MLAVYMVTIAIGAFMIVVAIFNWDLWFYDAESRVVEMIGGETLVRWYWGVAGVILIVSVAVHAIWGWWLW